MQITQQCRRLALQEVFREYGVAADGRLPYHDIQRSWVGTGLRRSDLDEAFLDALGSGDVIELHTDEGRLAVLTISGHRKAVQAPVTVQEIEQQKRALVALEWARARTRQRVYGLMHRTQRSGDNSIRH